MFLLINRAHSPDEDLDNPSVGRIRDIPVGDPLQPLQYLDRFFVGDRCDSMIAGAFCLLRHLLPPAAVSHSPRSIAVQNCTSTPPGAGAAGGYSPLRTSENAKPA